MSLNCDWKLIIVELKKKNSILLDVLEYKDKDCEK